MTKRIPLVAVTLLTLTVMPQFADARGGRTTIADCKAGSTDPDCPDEPDAAPDNATPKNKAVTSNRQQPFTAGATARAASPASAPNLSSRFHS